MGEETLLVQSKREMQIDAKHILGIEYAHIRLPNEDDLYVTLYGLPFIEQLMPRNWWSDKDWFRENAVRLSGSSSIYRIRTKRVNNRSIDIVLKWNRMGQDIPGEALLENGYTCVFNSPFEEFSLLMELRDSRYVSPGAVYTHRPLAIYVPHERKDLDRLGRRAYKMLPIIETHRELELDMFRSYAVIYEWIKGIDAVQAADRGILTQDEISALTLRVEGKVRQKGFLVHDRKPHHIIVRPRNGREVAKDKQGEFLCALVDFELLKRTPEREEQMKRTKHMVYVKKQRDKFNHPVLDYPPNLSHVEIMGVDYVHGNVESTKGKLWVVGKDPDLLDYFLPERWEVMPRVKLRTLSEVYHTVSKDDVHLVWKVSNVGSKPDMDPFRERERRILKFGYNSPFEEISLALHLNAKGIPTIAPIAIYMAGHKTEMADFLLDESRYTSHEHLLNPDGTPVLRRDRSYITLWGCWNQPVAEHEQDGPLLGECMSALHSYRKKLIGEEEYFHLKDLIRDRLMAVRVEDLNLNGSHFLVCVDENGSLVKEELGEPAIRICYFELLKSLQ